MGYNTKIDWCDSSWNPITGCLHGCEYCYARGIALRYGGYDDPAGKGITTNCPLKRAELSEPLTVTWKDGEKRKAPYPFGFMPTLHRYRLDIPKKWSEPRTIFVCSMSDLFGEWVPLEWIQEVFEACKAAPIHRYLFLTKNPARYNSLAELAQLPEADNFWFGTTVPKPETPYFFSEGHNTFSSIEPLHAKFGVWGFKHPRHLPNWIIIGAETGNRKGKIIPEKDWVDEIARQARENAIPVFMKESLHDLMGDDFRQEFPWSIKEC